MTIQTTFLCQKIRKRKLTENQIKCSRADSRVKMWKFSEISGTNEIVCNANLMQQVLLLIYILSSTCFGYINPSSGALDDELQHMVFCTVLWMSGGLESRCIGRVYGANGAVHHPHRTHDLYSGCQDHHPSKISVQKTIYCNSTPNAPDDGRMYPKQWIKLPCCVKLTFHIILWGRCKVKQPSNRELTPSPTSGCWWWLGRNTTWYYQAISNTPKMGTVLLSETSKNIHS